MAQRRQDGSVLGFVLVGALLATLLIGGIFVVRHNTTNTNNTGSSSGVASNKDKADNTKKDDQSAAKNQDIKEALEAQAAAEKKAQEQKAAAEASENKPAPSTPVQVVVSDVAPSTTENLPTTGPTDSLLPLIGAMLIVGAGIAYRRSRSLA